MKTLTIGVLAATLATPIAVAPVQAQHMYHGHNRHYYRHCRRSSGTTGLLAGAGVGGLGAAALGGPVGIAAGVIGGGLLGRHIDKRHDAAQNRRNGC